MNDSNPDSKPIERPAVYSIKVRSRDSDDRWDWFVNCEARNTGGMSIDSGTCGTLHDAMFAAARTGSEHGDPQPNFAPKPTTAKPTLDEQVDAVLDERPPLSERPHILGHSHPVSFYTIRLRQDCGKWGWDVYDMYEHLRDKRNFRTLDSAFASMKIGVKTEVDKRRPKPPLGTIVEAHDGREMAYTNDGWAWLLPDNTVPKEDSE